MIEFVLVVRSGRRLAGVDRDGTRLIRRCENVDKVRSLLQMAFDCGNLVEFIGLGWHCVREGNRYYWTRIRDIENYAEDLRSIVVE